MMGKAGVSMMIRIKQTDGAFILNGVVKDISFNDFQRPAGLEINIAVDDNWRRIQATLPDGDKSSGILEPFKNSAVMGADRVVEQSSLMAPGPENISVITTHKKTDRSEHRESSYDKRFYQSLVGKQLDNYRAISVIGIGNMGGVLQGWDVALEREVALKIISYKLSSKEAFRELFIKEARVISKLNHPNIAHIYHIGTSNEILYYAMEFIEGITLKEIIKQHGSIELTKGLIYLQTVCDAMEIIYQNSIVHRDIKPANLMISREGIVKIVDFGVAHAHDARSNKGRGEKRGLYGTPLYMSPEQIAGLAIDHRSDMYALGATFYHAFSGSPPFQANDIKGLLRHHLNTPLTPLKEKNPSVSEDLSDIIDKMMAKDPFERYDNFRLIKGEIIRIRSREKY